MIRGQFLHLTADRHLLIPQDPTAKHYSEEPRSTEVTKSAPVAEDKLATLKAYTRAKGLCYLWRKVEQRSQVQYHSTTACGPGIIGVL
jgi:hypothetical protein